MNMDHAHQKADWIGCEYMHQLWYVSPTALSWCGQGRPSYTNRKSWSGIFHGKVPWCHNIMVIYGTFQGKISQNTAYYNDTVTTSIHIPHQLTCMHPNHLVFVHEEKNQQYNIKYNFIQVYILIPMCTWKLYYAELIPRYMYSTTIVVYMFHIESHQLVYKQLQGSSPPTM